MNTLPELISAQVLLIVAPEAAWPGMLDLSARLSLRGALRVLDGGNQYNAYHVARALRRQTLDLRGALARIDLARVFTCYQMETLLLNAVPQVAPTLVLDFLATFYDENVPYAERRRLLARCAALLQRLSRRAPVVVSARPAFPGQAERASLLDLLARSADQVLEAEPPPEPLTPPRLF
ncbi:MAG: hypothetical protein EHM39_07395 [Chloroflexi bacterium]|nr:MAG: hypothetical protein EHM39_07395 [Chloroflexota bacterium]